MQFEGKVVIITGAGKGIGRAAALAFANEGAQVVCNSMTDSGRAVAESIGNRRASLFVQGDVSDEKVSARIVAETIRKFGKIDILFNNAGIVIPGDTRPDNSSRLGPGHVGQCSQRIPHVHAFFPTPCEVKGCHHQQCLFGGFERRWGEICLYRVKRRDSLHDSFDGGGLSQARYSGQLHLPGNHRYPLIG